MFAPSFSDSDIFYVTPQEHDLAQAILLQSTSTPRHPGLLRLLLAAVNLFSSAPKEVSPSYITTSAISNRLSRSAVCLSFSPLKFVLPHLALQKSATASPRG